MDSIIETFHIDLKLLLAQVINFVIVFAVLYYFGIIPLMKIMKERSAKIEKSLDDAKAAEAKLIEIEKDHKETIAKARQEAAKILEDAKKIADQRRVDMLQKAKDEIGTIINQEKEKMVAEKAKVIKDIRAEVADLVTASVEKILDKKLDSKEDKELIKKNIK